MHAHSCAFEAEPFRKLVAGSPPIACAIEVVRRETAQSTGALACAAVRQVAPHPPAWARLLADPELVLDWLAASKEVKDMRRVANVASSFARIFAQSAKVSPEELVGGLQRIGYETLRIARVRLDQSRGSAPT